MLTREDFNAIYWAAQPPEVRALKTMPVGNEQQIHARYSAAFDLAKRGFVIDKEIHTYDRDPFTTMVAMRDQGYTWYPALLQNPNYDLAPGVVNGMPGNVISGGSVWPNRPYNPNAPMPGSIKVSIDPEDYPPFDAAPEPPPPVSQGVPGAFMGHNLRGLIPGDNSPAGTVWTDEVGKAWVKRVIFGIGNLPSVWWEPEGK